MTLVSLCDAKLYGTNFEQAEFWICSLKGAELKHANLAGATIFLCDLRDVDLRGAKMKEVSHHYKNKKSQPLIADIEGSSMEGVKMMLRQFGPTIIMILKMHQ
jgi:uncharacterized protein YjbI with pentapeptide repeats